MTVKRFYYLLEIQYLGFRYHGFQKQPNVKTIQYMLERTLNYVLGHTEHKTLPSGRTDAMVSANHMYVELFLKESIDQDDFFEKLNFNLPADIRALSVTEVDDKFNVIQNPKNKEYIYLFSTGAKNHPFAAPYICHFQDELDIELMKKGAECYVGLHNFQNYAYKPSEQTQFVREVVSCEIKINNLFTANFFPDISYAFIVKGAGFMRYQVRLMVGTLVELGRGTVTWDEFEQSLKEKRNSPFTYIAPASGLMLNHIDMV